MVLVGLQTGGVPLAAQMAEVLRQIEGATGFELGTLDVAFYRDDIGLRPVLPEAVTDIPVDLAGKVVVLVDDVLFTGRTIRAALNALNDFGRARAVQLAVMVDRGHRELPIRPDYVGKNLPTSREEMVDVGEDGRVDRHPGGRSDAPRTCSRSPTSGADGIAEVLRVADAFAEVERRSIPKVPTLRGKVVATLFFEESTRTRLSFETAAKRLSADVISLAVASSSVKKGESLRDTVETVEAMGIDAVIIRHASSGAPHQVARWVERARVINAGDGWHEHPTQALIDCFTVRQVLAERKGVAPGELGVDCFEGLRVLIVGDIRHSRVARSEVLAYTALGAHVTLAAPGQPAPALAGGVARRGGARPRCRAGRRRRGVAAPAPGRTGERFVRAQPARVHRRLGAHGPPGGPPGRRGHRHPPRPHGARRGDRLGRGRPAAHRGDPPGDQRRGRAHGHPVPPPRRGEAGLAEVPAVA